MENKQMPRRNLVTGDPIQTKYLALFITSMVIPFAAFIGCINYILYKISISQYDISGQAPGDIFAVLMKINYVMLFGFPIFFMIVLVLGVIMSNRLIGPLKRITRELNTAADSGDASTRLFIRKNDYIKPLVDAINRLLDAVSKKIK